MDPQKTADGFDEGEAIRGEVVVERSLTETHRVVCFTVAKNHGRGWRIDKYLHAICPTMSRSLLRRWVDAGHVTVDGKLAQYRDKVKPGQRVAMLAPLPERDEATSASDLTPLVILLEDSDFLVLAKPAGMLAHQAGRTMSGTLINQLHEYMRARERDPSDVRLVNRIDRDTSGIVLASLSDAAHAKLSAAMEARDLYKEYRAICRGVPDPRSGSWLDPIGQAGEESIAMRVDPAGKPSHTDYEVLATAHGEGGDFSQLRLILHTGRQHQIRVHAAHHGHALVGDWVYGQPIAELPGQALHAAVMAFTHPRTGATVRVEAPLPERLVKLWEQIATGGALQPITLDSEQRSKLGLSERRVRRPNWLSDAEYEELKAEDAAQRSVDPD
jgi:23S rRNA pseudouridine1911/1915/1917 synthase